MINEERSIQTAADAEAVGEETRDTGQSKLRETKLDRPRIGERQDVYTPCPTERPLREEMMQNNEEPEEEQDPEHEKSARQGNRPIATAYGISRMICIQIRRD